ISKDDLNKSGIRVRENIKECLEWYENRTALGEDGMYALYQAYLHTFCTPLSVAGRVGRDSVSNLQVYLENKLREHLSKIKIKCVEALPHPLYPDEQIRLSLKTKGVASTGLTYTINCQSINAQKQLSTDLTPFDVLMLPNAPSEEFSCELVLGCIPFSKNNDLNILSETELITWPVRFSANMQKVISIDFTAKETGNMVKLSPNINHLSVRTFEWLIDGKKVGSEQTLTIAQNEIASRSVTLRLNNNDSLSVTKTAAEMRIKKTEVISPVKEEKKADSTTLAVRKSTAVPDPLEFANLNDFSSLQMRLDALKKSGKIAVAKKETFINPDKCWVILVDPNDKQVKHCLAPGKEQRIDIKTEQTYVDFESKLKGLIALWVEVY
ncbi:MAG: PKD-like domain-containing protein, partial [Bacteroidia bacterium]